jgi:Tol biopolymer transport system component
VPLRSAIVGTVALALALLATSCGSNDDSDENAASAAKAVGPCRIAFRARVADYPDAPSDIYVVNRDRTGLRKLTLSPDLHEWSPEWSPDGRRIAFSATRTYGDATQIFVMSADGSGRRQLTRPDAAGAYSDMRTWSRDGRTIFYTRLQLSGRVTSWAMNADGSDKRRIQGFEDSALVSPDGEQVAGIRNSGLDSYYYGSPDVYVVKSNGDDGRWLTRSGDTELFGWSPDGEWILYKRMAGAAGFYIVKPDGSERRRLTHGPEDYEATWSPDGESILYASQSVPEGLHLVARDGGPPRRLTPKVDDLSASWSATGSRIVFVRNAGIWTVNRDGTGLRLVAQPHGAPVYELPAWSPACK